MIITGTRCFASAGSTSVIDDVDVDRRIRRVVDVTGELPRNDATAAERAGVRRGDLPLDLRHVLGNATEYFALEVLDDLGATSRPLLRASSTLRPFVEREDVGQLRERIRLRLVVVGVIRILLVAARPRAQRRDAELLHHLPVVFGGGPVLRFRGWPLLGARLKGAPRRRVRQRIRRKAPVARCMIVCSWLPPSFPQLGCPVVHEDRLRLPVNALEH